MFAGLDLDSGFDPQLVAAHLHILRQRRFPEGDFAAGAVVCCEPADCPCPAASSRTSCAFKPAGQVPAAKALATQITACLIQVLCMGFILAQYQRILSVSRCALRTQALDGQKR